MAEIIIMPKLGFNMSEGKLVKWYKSEGETVKKGENLFSIETDKTNIDIEATADGTVRRLFIKEGDTLPVTLPIAIVGGADENIEVLLHEAEAQLSGTAAAAAGNADNDADTGKESPLMQQPQAAPQAGGRIMISPRARRAAEEAGLDVSTLAIAGTGYAGGICEKDVTEYIAGHKIKATPLAGAVAAAEGIDLSAVTGTGANGKIMKADVMGASADASAPAAAAASDEGAAYKRTADGRMILEEIPYSGVRKIIGDKLAESKFTAPHLYFTQKVDMQAVLAMRKEINAAQDEKTSVTDYIAKAVILALQKFPEMNAALIDDRIVRYRSINLGIAVASPTGLIVPNLKDAQDMGVIEISKNSKPLFAKAREGRLAPDEYSCGTFTISNLGMFGIENFTAIINPPELGILSISSTKDEPLVVTDEAGNKSIDIRPMMNITLSVDHRVIDGLLASQVVTEVKRLLEHPISLMI